MKRIGREHTTCIFSSSARPVAEVRPGEELRFETLDATGGRIQSDADVGTVQLPREQVNPATGPVYVQEARPGDTLVVEILEISLGPRGHSGIRPGKGVIIHELKPPCGRIVPVENGIVIFSPSIRLPARPMIGVIGVAPAGEPVITYYPGPHGGNLDINDIAVGAKVYLPVSVEGALLAIGDVHAIMGDGELTGGGVDISAEVAVRLDLLRGQIWRRPWVETPTQWVTCANASNLPDAIRLATSDMATLLAARLSISREEAFMLIGACGDARPGQAAELGMDATARVGVPKLA